MTNYQTSFVSCFSIGDISESPGMWNLNLFSFLQFIFTFGNVKEMMCSKDKSVELLQVLKLWRSFEPTKPAWLFFVFSELFTLIWISQLWATLLAICHLTFWCYQVHSTKNLQRRHFEEDRQKTMYCKTYHGRILQSWNVAKILSNIWHWFWYLFIF